MLAKQKYADGGIISPANDSWEYKKEGDNYLTRKQTGDGKWITAKGDPLEHIKAKIYKETDAISKIKTRSEVSSGTQSQKTGAVQTSSEKKEEKVKSSQLLRTGHGGWQQTAQEFLHNQGEYLGGTGPRGEGVDGDWGPTSQAALDNYKKRVDPMALPLVTKNAYGEEECNEWGCSKLASAKASGFLNLIKGNNTASTWADNAWFNKSHQLNEGGELIYNEPKRGDMGYVPKELYGILQVGDYVHLNRAGSTYDKEVHKTNPSIRNEKIEHMGMIIGKDKNGVPLVYHGSEKGKAYIQPINKPLPLPSEGLTYWVSSIVRPKDLIEADFSNLKESKYHRPYIDVDKKDQLVALPGSSGYQRDAIITINQNYKNLAHMGGHTQDEINMAGEVLLGGILNMESKAMNTEYIGNVAGVDVPHPLNNRYSYGAFVKGKEILASAYKHPIFEGVFTDESRIEVFGKNLPAPGIGEASKSPYQFKPKMHFGTNARPTVLGESLYQNFNIRPEDADDNQKNQTIAAMAILLNNMSSIKKRNNYDSKTDTYDNVPLPYILAKSWQGGAGFVSKEKYQDLIDDLDITYSNVALKEGREDITSGKGSTIDEAIFDTIEEKETARVEDAIRKINEEITKRTLNLQQEFNQTLGMPSESTDVHISSRNYKHGGPHKESDKYQFNWGKQPEVGELASPSMTSEFDYSKVPTKPEQSTIEQSAAYKGMIEADKLSKGELTGTGKAEALHGLNDPVFNLLLLGAPASLGLGAKAGSKLAKGLKGLDYVNPLAGFKGPSPTLMMGLRGNKGIGTSNSSLPWGKWNPDTPKNKSLMGEYAEIERKAKADGTWMKNKDGSEFKGSKMTKDELKDIGFDINPNQVRQMQFIQSKSKNFPKKALKDDAGNIEYNFNAARKPRAHSTRDSFNTESDTYYFTPDKQYTKDFVRRYKGEEGITKPFVLSPKKQYEMKDDWINYHNVQELKENKLFRFGSHDAIKGREDYDWYHDIANFDGRNIKGNVMLGNKNIKAAIGNSGIFDMKSSNIYKGLIPGAVAGAALNKEYQDGGPHFPKDRKYDTEKKYKKSNVLPGMKKGGRVCKLSDLI